MKKFIFFSFLSLKIFAQQTGTEQLVPKNIYKGDFTVAGDKDTYYAVVFKYGEQNMINHLKIYRSYHEAGPNELSLTHKGGLLLEFDVNYGGWGGQAYGWKVANHQYAYHTTFANATHSMWNMGFTVWLRGGGFVYHYESEKPAQLQVAYSTTEVLYSYPGYPQYTVYAPAVLTAVNTANIAAHSVATKSDIPLNPWTIAGNTLSYTGGAVAIGTTNPKSYKFAVGGTAVAEKVKVSKQTSWSDFVFESDYPLIQLDSVSQYIQTNKHLPHIPSAHQVATEGYDLGDMDALLLRKIEELTLYIIQQDKKIESLKAKQGSRKRRRNN